MTSATKDQFVSYDLVSPGYEATYTGETDLEAAEKVSAPAERLADEVGRVYRKWPMWTWTGVEIEWGDEIIYINEMQKRLGPLDEKTREIRAHIASLAHCETGFPVIVDALLDAVGTGSVKEPAFHNGCFYSLGKRATAPRHNEVMQHIEGILNDYLARKPRSEVMAKYPGAEGFIRRVYQWLGEANQLTIIQQLMLERMLLPFEWFARRNPDAEAVHKNCFEEGGRGPKIDEEISRLTGLPKIYPNYMREYWNNLEAISETSKRDLYRICCRIAHGIHYLSDCHHSAFRWIESWIHGIGTGKVDISSRQSGAERQRIGTLLLSYVLGLDEWLKGTPMQFLLLDLGHVYLGFDPKNEVLRVCVYLGEERTQVKEWLAACLWYHLHCCLHRGERHQELIARAAQAGYGLRGWMDAALAKKP
jgi:hypothetical protein